MQQRGGNNIGKPAIEQGQRHTQQERPEQQRRDLRRGQRVPDPPHGDMPDRPEAAGDRRRCQPVPSRGHAPEQEASPRRLLRQSRGKQVDAAADKRQDGGIRITEQPNPLRKGVSPGDRDAGERHDAASPGLLEGYALALPEQAGFQAALPQPEDERNRRRDKDKPIPQQEQSAGDRFPAAFQQQGEVAGKGHQVDRTDPHRDRPIDGGHSLAAHSRVHSKFSHSRRLPTSVPSGSRNMATWFSTPVSLTR